jgi:flagellar biosynthesis/type III secretory pathway chaperone
MINQLLQVIGQEAHLFEDFLALLDQQKQMLVSNDVATLNEVTELQRQKILESQRLNRIREELIAEIQAENAIEGDVTVARLLEFADRNQAERLLQLKEIIFSLNDRITEARNTNAMLLNQSREFISRTMRMLSKIKNPDKTYDRRGVAPDGQSTIVVDRRI